MNFSQVEGGIPPGDTPLGLNADSSPVVFAPNAHGELLRSDSGVCLAVMGYGFHRLPGVLNRVYNFTF